MTARVGQSYAASLRSPQKKVQGYIEEGVPFFVPNLSKVKTNTTCIANHPELLFRHEDSKNGANKWTTLSYRKQGDVTMYTDHKLSIRTKLQQDKLVHTGMIRFWETFNSVRRGRNITKKEFVDVFTKMFKALVPPNEFSIKEAYRIVAKDWERDAANCTTMDKQHFARSLFEVVDIWTPDLGVQSYVKFLTHLYKRITMVVYDQEKAVYLTKFAELDAIKSFFEVDPEDDLNDGGPLLTSRKSTKAPLARGKTIAAIQISDPTPKKDSPRNNTKKLPLMKRRSTNSRNVSSTAVGEYDNASQDPISARSPDKPKDLLREGGLEIAIPSDNSVLSTVPPSKSPVRRPRDGEKRAGGESIAMPSIYLSPEIEMKKEDSSLAARRLKENLKFIQRLRRETF